MTDTATGGPYTVAEIAAALGRTPLTIRRHIAAGDIRAVRLWGTRGPWYIPAAELERLLARATISPTAPASGEPRP